MSETGFDFAVFGSTVLARLLAGLLASAHGRKVLFIGTSQAAYRLPRTLDLSLAPITRPETWALMGEGLVETQRLMRRLGIRTGVQRVDPLFLADTPIAAEALSHIRHMAQGFRTTTEPAAPSLLGPGRAGTIFRDALLLDGPALEPQLDLWLDKYVTRVEADSVSMSPDGSGAVVSGTTTHAFSQAVLADDDAILAHLPPRQWPALLERQARATAIMTPERALPASLLLDIGSGTIVQRQRHGIMANGPGTVAALASRVQGLLGLGQIEMAGQSAFTGLATADGAPAVGRVGGTGADIVAGMGVSGAFFTPALARWLAGEAQSHQDHWFAARLVSRGTKSAIVTEYTPQGAVA
jgi:hypothetical protein